MGNLESQVFIIMLTSLAVLLVGVFELYKMSRQFIYTGEIPPGVSYNVQRIEEYLEFFHKYFRRHVVRFRREARNRGVPVTTDDIVRDLMRQAATMVKDLEEGPPSHHMSLENRLFIMKLIKDEEAKMIVQLMRQLSQG